MTLFDLLKNNDKRILFVGIGNILKGDDGVGVFISEQIHQTNLLTKLIVEVSIENYIGKIQKLNPDILVLIDCVDMNSPPGSFKLIPIEQVSDQTFNTHSISLKRLSDFFSMPIFILGIQPEKVDFRDTLSYIVLESAKNIIQTINKEEVYYG